MPINWSIEFPQIEAIASRYNVDPFFVAAIRFSENGGPGREFGVLSVPAPTWDDQCAVACGSVRNQLAAFPQNPLKTMGTPNGHRLIYRREFVEAFAEHWAPQNVANDPNHLNQNWLDNCMNFYFGHVAMGVVK